VNRAGVEYLIAGAIVGAFVVWWSRPSLDRLVKRWQPPPPAERAPSLPGE